MAWVLTIAQLADCQIPKAVSTLLSAKDNQVDGRSWLFVIGRC